MSKSSSPTISWLKNKLTLSPKKNSNHSKRGNSPADISQVTNCSFLSQCSDMRSSPNVSKGNSPFDLDLWNSNGNLISSSLLLKPPRYASIGACGGRRAGSLLSADLLTGQDYDYYAEFAGEENDSVCSLPVRPPPPSFALQDWIYRAKYANNNNNASGTSTLSRTAGYLYQSSRRGPASSIGSIMEEEFAFLNEFTDKSSEEEQELDELEQYYFLPAQVKDEAWQRWKNMESKREYDIIHSDCAKEEKTKPLFFKGIAGKGFNEKGKTNHYYNANDWF